MSDQDEKILRTAAAWKVPESRSKEDVWSALEKQIEEGSNRNTGYSRQKWLAAASITLIAALGVLYVLLSQRTEINTGVAQQQRIELPDGSLVVLNAESKLSYVSSSYEKNRRLKLKGEGFFDVKPGNSFIVEMNDVEVRVLGTSFNIYSRNELIEVKCATGKVEVSNGQQTVVLEPGYAVRSSQGALDEKPVNFEASSAITWQQGKFQFTNEPLSRVVRELEIQFGVTVLADDLEGKMYTGYFDNSDLEKAAKQVFSPMGFSYEIRNKEIIVK